MLVAQVLSMYASIPFFNGGLNMDKADGLSIYVLTILSPLEPNEICGLSTPQNFP